MVHLDDMDMDSEPLDHLYEESQRLAHVANQSDIPRPHRNLTELEELSRKLVSKTTIPTDASDVKG
jgi:hypothetical protein